MKQTRGRVVLVESLADFDDRYAAGVRNLSGWRVRGLDLRGRSEQLASCRVGSATFLGCQFDEGVDDRLSAEGALVLPALADVPVDVYRSRLYAPDELYDEPAYAASLDARAYAWSQSSATQETALARALHDHAIDEALGTWVEGRSLVGVMGGHAAERGSEDYRQAALLGHGLGQRHVVATGGGPGAMEAANLGALLARQPVTTVEAACRELAAVPSFRPSVEAWAGLAQQVRTRQLADADEGAQAVDSLGIPTWHYGHEPPNVFASAIAKFFGNPVREATLLEVCDAGIVFLPGAGGTVQEIFQDACENYYADESSVAEMVLVGAAYWTDTLPAWPLLQALAKGRLMESRVHLVDSVAEAAQIVNRRADPADRR